MYTSDRSDHFCCTALLDRRSPFLSIFECSFVQLTSVTTVSSSLAVRRRKMKSIHTDMNPVQYGAAYTSDRSDCVRQKPL